MAAQDDVRTVLDQARADARAGRHEQALERHLWFHTHARDVPGMTGVRRSFALSDWAGLGRGYAPALEAMRGVRDEAVNRLRAGAPAVADHDDWNDVSDVTALNRALQEPAATVELYEWLVTHRPSVAERAASVVRSTLLDQGRIDLASAHLGDPFARIDDHAAAVNLLRTQDAVPVRAGAGSTRDVVIRNFCARVREVAQILRASGRDEDAERYLSAALDALHDPTARAEVHDGLQS